MIGIKKAREESINNYIAYCQENGIDYSAGHSTIWK